MRFTKHTSNFHLQLCVGRLFSAVVQRRALDSEASAQLLARGPYRPAPRAAGARQTRPARRDATIFQARDMRRFRRR